MFIGRFDKAKERAWVRIFVVKDAAVSAVDSSEMVPQEAETQMDSGKNANFPTFWRKCERKSVVPFGGHSAVLLR